MNTGPKGALTPLEMLENNEMFEPSIISVWFNPVMGASIAFGCSILANLSQRRPAFSGIQRHLICTAAGFFIGRYLDGVQDGRLADRDAMYRHYIQLHPEDFPTTEPKKVKDILEHWYPSR